MFWIMPILGGALAGFVHRSLLEPGIARPPVTGRPASERKAVHV
jgi:hypothetical protein